MTDVTTELIEQLTRGEHGQPHAILGPHPDAKGVTIRAYKPLARTVTAVLSDGTEVPLEHVHDGVWAGRVSTRPPSAAGSTSEKAAAVQPPNVDVPDTSPVEAR